MKTKYLPLKLSVCMAIGGFITIIVICFLIGFGFHSTVGKYALGTALFLQWLSLVVDHFTHGPRLAEDCPYTPAKKMTHFRLIVIVIWLLGSCMQLASLGMILFGMTSTNLWVRILCIAGFCLSPLGWAGILLASHRRRTAGEVILARKTANPVA